jgi:hypothetical protein
MPTHCGHMLKGSPVSAEACVQKQHYLLSRLWGAQMMADGRVQNVSACRMFRACLLQ